MWSTSDQLSKVLKYSCHLEIIDAPSERDVHQMKAAFNVCRLGRNGWILCCPSCVSLIWSQTITRRWRVDFKATIDPASLHTLPTRYQYVVNLLPGVVVARGPWEAVYVFCLEPQSCYAKPLTFAERETEILHPKVLVTYLLGGATHQSQHWNPQRLSWDHSCQF